MKLFTIGPVDMFSEVKKFRSELTIPYFRTSEFSNLMLDTDLLLKKLAGASDEAKTIYLTASGTAAMEATVINCFSTDDKVLVVNGGTFGQRFVDICRVHGIPFSEVKLAYGEVLTDRHFEDWDNQKFNGVLVNLHETSTGQLYDIKLIADFCKRNNSYLIVDAISTFLCDDFDMERYNIDAMITSSQKGVCIEPGMSMVVLSKRILERIATIDPKSIYFSFADYIRNFNRGQTPFTPAVGICIQLNFALHLIDKKGLKNHLCRIKEIAEDFRTKLKALPVSVPTFPLSNALTPIVFENDIAYDVFETLKNEYDIFVNPTGGELHNKVLRVAHIGQIDFSDNTRLIQCLYDILNHKARN